jgi:hypothetical protein
MKRAFFCTVLLCVAPAGAARSATDERSREQQEPGDKTRAAAEWEPAVGVLIGWPLKLPKSLVVELAGDVELYVTVADKGAEDKARATFKDWGIDPKRTRFLTTKQGDGYFLTRDWGRAPCSTGAASASWWTGGTATTPCPGSTAASACSG